MTPEQIAHFTLENGLEVVIIPDHRAPVATHMLWYRNGSADDPPRKSGIAHFLEHLMFKGTHKHPLGEFSDLVASLGGQENAFTSYDYTAYYQRVPREHLKIMMEYEADRMRHLVLTDDIVAPERDVVLEERRMYTDADPSAQLYESVQSSLFSHHPYGTPIIGWEHEIAKLNQEDAFNYYERFYTPENAILVVAGDVEAREVHSYAKETYGRIPQRGPSPVRLRPQEPTPLAHRLVTLKDEKVHQPSVQRVFLVPSYCTAEAGEAEALDILTNILGGGPTSRLYRSLVSDRKMAVSVGAYYMGQSLDTTRLWLYAVPAPEISLKDLDMAMVEVLHHIQKEGISEEELSRTKTQLIAETVYAQDSQTSLAKWYGAALSLGQSIKDIQAWPSRIDRVLATDVQKVANQWLLEPRSVTGYLESSASLS